MVRPDRKVTIGGLVGSVVTIAVWVVGEVWAFDVPPGVEGALVVLLTFVVGYVVRNTGQGEADNSRDSRGGPAVGQIHARQAKEQSR